MRHFLLALRPGIHDRSRLMASLRQLGAQLVLNLPHALIVVAHETQRDSLASLPGVTHAGGVEMTGRPIRRLRVLPDGRTVPAAPQPA